MIKKYTLLILLGLIIGILLSMAFFFYVQEPEKQIIYRDKVVTTCDTLWKIDTIKNVQIVSKGVLRFDTCFVSDTVVKIDYSEFVSQIDTVIQPFNDTISIMYKYPANEFNIFVGYAYREYPVITRLETIEIIKPEEWYQSPYFQALTGVALFSGGTYLGSRIK